MAESLSDVAIMCPDPECCGTLTERVVGRPQCNECGTYFAMCRVSSEEAEELEQVE